jgi:hypothetical protein
MDHSYKTTQQIMKVNGESVFQATLTLTNEFSEACVMAFVPTSSHSEFESALQKAKENLDQYGLLQPEVMFTDNPAADKQFLERVFPSLTKNVVPVEKNPAMEIFKLPNDVTIRVSCDAAAIENEIAKITVDINLLDDSEKLVVGFNAEWNVDTTSNMVQPTAIIQIAYKTWVNVFQIGHFNGKLPQALISFLSNGQILKAGWGVKQDLDRPAKECDSAPFHGGVELAKLAKDYRVISDTRIGVEDLCAHILAKRLEKPQDICVSQNWSNTSLSSEQTEYAALDALASLYIYTRLTAAEMSGRITPNALPGTLVSVYNLDNQLIAHGSISGDNTPLPGAPSVTSTSV